MAPEMLKHEPHNHMLDVWSLGILLYELCHS
jgi:serine/threonine protein kinase